MDKLKEAVSICNGLHHQYHQALSVIIDLAEQYLTVGAKMPSKHTLETQPLSLQSREDIRNYRNDAIDQCTLAFTAILAEKEQAAYIKGYNDGHKAFAGKWVKVDC